MLSDACFESYAYIIMVYCFEKNLTCGRMRFPLDLAACFSRISQGNMTPDVRNLQQNSHKPDSKVGPDRK